jgi:hypothetical protein
MAHFTLRDVFWFTLVVGMGVGWWTHQRGLNEKLHSLAAEAKYARVLGSETNAEFIETPLKDALEYFSNVHGIPIKLDLPSLEQAGLGESTGITLFAKGRTLDETLLQALDDRAKVVVTESGLLIVGVKPPPGARRGRRVGSQNAWERAERRAQMLEAYLGENGKRVRWLADDGKEKLEITDQPPK